METFMTIFSKYLYILSRKMLALYLVLVSLMKVFYHLETINELTGQLNVTCTVNDSPRQPIVTYKSRVIHYEYVST